MALSDNLVAFWDLDETSGQRNDSHGTNHLADNNTVGSASGFGTTVADFEASNSEYLSIADNAALSMGDIDFTIACWVNLESKPANEMDIISKFETVGNQREYRLRWLNSTDRIEFVVSATGTTTLGIITAATFGAPSLATWYFVVAQHDSVTNQLFICVNDGTVDSAGHSTGVNNGTSPLHIGALGRASPAFYFDGLIGRGGIWKRLLSSAEITELYNGGNGRDYAYISGGAGGASVAPLAMHYRRLRQ